MRRGNKWDHRFLGLAVVIASWSKDPSTQVAAIAVNEKRNILATGYNGFPRRILDLPERYSSRELKYKYVLHAEQNLISNATANGISLSDSIVYIVGLPPCERCALELIQADIKEVVILKSMLIPHIEVDQSDWGESWKFSVSLFREASVGIVVVG